MKNLHQEKANTVTIQQNHHIEMKADHRKGIVQLHIYKLYHEMFIRDFIDIY